VVVSPHLIDEDHWLELPILCRSACSVNESQVLILMQVLSRYSKPNSMYPSVFVLHNQPRRASPLIGGCCTGEGSRLQLIDELTPLNGQQLLSNQLNLCCDPGGSGFDYYFLQNVTSTSSNEEEGDQRDAP
jgi:hypothetical protein